MNNIENDLLDDDEPNPLVLRYALERPKDNNQLRKRTQRKYFVPDSDLENSIKLKRHCLSVMSQQVLDLSKLDEFLHNTLRSTEDVKNILQSQCNEAKYVLAPWRFKTITQKEVDENSCSCPRIVSTEDHVKEIASGIDRAVVQARKLRERLAANVLEEKKLARKPSVREIYAPGSGDIGSKAKWAESKGDKENGGDKRSKNDNIRGDFERNETNRMERTKQAAMNDHSLSGKNSKTWNAKEKGRTERAAGCDIEKKAEKATESKKITDKKLIGTSPYNSLVAASKVDQKSKGKKNFIAANKSSIKNIKTAGTSKSQALPSSKIEVTKNAAQGSSASRSSDSRISWVSSAAEFENLISKISLESENGFVKSGATLAMENGCPVHDKNVPKYVEEKVCTSVDAAEGLDRFGVPSGLVKSLRVYHSYLNSDSQSHAANWSDKRGDKAADNFLAAFDTMNRNRRKVSCVEKLENLCADFLPVLKESCRRNMDFIELSKLKIRYTDLDTTCKSLGLRSFSPTKRSVSRMIENRCENQSKSWKLNAVWNKACIPSLEVMSRARCVRYSNRSQLLTLFDSVQRMQQLKYLGNLADLLVDEIVPMVRNSLEPGSQEFVEAYKMISTICNLFNLRVPVLVRTDK